MGRLPPARATLAAAAFLLAAAGRLEAQPEREQPACSEPRLTAIRAAREAAFARSKRALERLMQRDTSLRGLAGGPTPGQQKGRALAERLFSVPVSTDDFKDDALPRLARMTLLQREAPVACAAAASRECSRLRWVAFVNGNSPPIQFCPAFFRPSADPTPLLERQARNVMHESAHAAGIGEPGHEAYCPLWDCETPCGQDSADAWAQLLHCLSGEPPDGAIRIRAGAP